MKTKSICILTTSYPRRPNDSMPKGKFVHDFAKSFVRMGFSVYVITQPHCDSKNFEVIDGGNWKTIKKDIMEFIAGKLVDMGWEEDAEKFSSNLDRAFDFWEGMEESGRTIQEE